MPKAKDPTDRRCASRSPSCTWPGARPRRSSSSSRARSRRRSPRTPRSRRSSRSPAPASSIVYVTLKEDVADRAQGVGRHQGQLDASTICPTGAGRSSFIKDFGDTATLMLTVASPKVSDVELELRAAPSRRRSPPCAAAATRRARDADRRASRPTSTSASMRRAVGDRVATLLRRAARHERRAAHRGPGLPRHRRRDHARRRQRCCSGCVEFAASGCACPSCTPTSGAPPSSAIRKTPRARLAAVAGDRYSYPRARRVHRHTSSATCRRVPHGRRR